MGQVPMATLNRYKTWAQNRDFFKTRLHIKHKICLDRKSMRFVAAAYEIQSVLCQLDSLTSSAVFQTTKHKNLHDLHKTHLITETSGLC